MKAYYIFIGVICTLMHQVTNAQIILQNFNVEVVCCSDSDSVDIGNDGMYDLKIKSMFEGIDSFNFNMAALQGNTQVQNNPVDIGTAFQPWWYTSGLIAQTMVLCYWSPMYEPGTGFKYQGFRTVNAPGDTTYGWVKLNFVGDFDCNDTVFVLQAAYCTIPNIPLMAGQTILTALEEVDEPSIMNIHPNPASEMIYVNGFAARSGSKFEIYDVNGKLAMQGYLISDEISIGSLQPGFYGIRMVSGNDTGYGKFVKD